MTGDPHTLAIHGDRPVPDDPGVAPPIHVSTTFDKSGDPVRYYRRESHATTERFEAVVGALEGGTAVAYPSGMAAIAAVLRLLRPARVALPEEAYHGTRELVAASDWQAAAPAELEAGDVWWVETPSNPRGLIADLDAVAAEAGRREVAVVVDSTFATPVLQRPLEHRVPFVVHAATKFLAGHSDAMGGVAVCARPDDAASLRAARSLDGAIPGSLDVWLALRGVRTLPLRVERQSASAAAIAGWLDGRVPRVWYPGLASHPGHEIAARQMRAFGAVVAFEVASQDEAAAVVRRFRLFRNATSLGGVESLAEHRIEADPESPPGLIRLSVGVEAPEDLIADLEQALGRASA